MDGALTFSLSGNNLGCNALTTLLAASSSLSNLKELRLYSYVVCFVTTAIAWVKTIVRMGLDVTDKLLCSICNGPGERWLDPPIPSISEPCVSVM